VRIPLYDLSNTSRPSAYTYHWRAGPTLRSLDSLDPLMPQRRPRASQDGAKTAPRRPRIDPRRPKTALGRPHDLKIFPRPLHDSLRRTVSAPKMPQGRFKTDQKRVKTLEYGPRLSLQLHQKQPGAATCQSEASISLYDSGCA